VPIDIDDVALGHQTKMRWNDRDDWVRSEQQTHEPLVPVELFEAGAAAPRSPTRTRSANATHQNRMPPRS
jgi:hypothetical protein